MLKTLQQKTVKVQVEYYDDHEKTKLLAYPSATEIQKTVQSSPIEISIEEFLTYYLFYNKRPGKRGYGSYEELRTNIRRALTELDGWVLFNGISICSEADALPQDIRITEKIGEAIGLSVVNRIHGLTAADWDRIPPKGGQGAPPVFDYQTASDGKNIMDGGRP